MIAPMALRIVERRKSLFIFAMSDETEAYRVFSYKLVLCDLFTPCNYRVLYVLEKKQNNFTIIMSVIRN